MSGCCRWAENFSFTHSFSFKRFKTVLFCFTGYQSFFPQSIIRIFYISSGLKKSRTLTSSLRVFKQRFLRRTGGATCAARSECQECTSVLAPRLSNQAAVTAALCYLSPGSSQLISASTCLLCQEFSRLMSALIPPPPPTPPPPPLNSACTWDESE